MQNEIGAAWGLRKRIVAVLYKIRREQVPDIIAQKKHFELNRFDELAREIRDRARRRKKS